MSKKDDLIRRSVKHFGLTDDCREAGFILDDGRMLDFSGKNEDSTARGKRYRDHSEISFAFSDKDFEDKSNEKLSSIEYFTKKTNAIRFGMVKGAKTKQYEMDFYLENFNHVTDAQRGALNKCCVRFDPLRDLVYEFYDKEGRLIESSLIENPSCETINKVLGKHKRVQAEL